MNEVKSVVGLLLATVGTIAVISAGGPDFDGDRKITLIGGVVIFFVGCWVAFL